MELGVKVCACVCECVCDRGRAHKPGETSGGPLGRLPGRGESWLAGKGRHRLYGPGEAG